MVKYGIWSPRNIKHNQGFGPHWWLGGLIPTPPLFSTRAQANNFISVVTSNNNVYKLHPKQYVPKKELKNG